MILTCHCGLTRNVADCPCGQPTFSEAELIELENAVLGPLGFDPQSESDVVFRVTATLNRLIALARNGDPISPLERDLRHRQYLESEFARIQAVYPLKEGAC